MRTIFMLFLTTTVLVSSQVYAKTQEIEHNNCNLLLALFPDEELSSLVSTTLTERGFHVKHISFEDLSRNALKTGDLWASSFGIGDCHHLLGTRYSTGEINWMCDFGLNIISHKTENLSRGSHGRYRGYDRDAYKIALNKFIDGIPTCTVKN